MSKPLFHMPMQAEVVSFQVALERLINNYSCENASNTPDYILAGYLKDCLDAWNRATLARETWYGRAPAPVEPPPPQSPS